MFFFFLPFIVPCSSGISIRCFFFSLTYSIVFSNCKLSWQFPKLQNDNRFADK